MDSHNVKALDSKIPLMMMRRNCMADSLDSMHSIGWLESGMFGRDFGYESGRSIFGRTERRAISYTSADPRLHVLYGRE